MEASPRRQGRFVLPGLDRKVFVCFVICLSLFSCSSTNQPKSNNWISLFDGKSLSNWKVSGNKTTFTLQDGMIVANGPVAHLFYDGEVQNHDFKNFEFKADVMTTPGSNSGIYFHTAWQESGWPKKGYEVQINNTQSDWRRTGSLYGIQNISEVYVKDNEWFTEYIKVEGKRIIIKLDERIVVDYTEPENMKRAPGNEARFLSSGTFALQGHDPDSKVYFKNIMVRVLPY